MIVPKFTRSPVIGDDVTVVSFEPPQKFTVPKLVNPDSPFLVFLHNESLAFLTSFHLFKELPIASPTFLT